MTRWSRPSARGWRTSGASAVCIIVQPASPPGGRSRAAPTSPRVPLAAPGRRSASEAPYRPHCGRGPLRRSPPAPAARGTGPVARLVELSPQGTEDGTGFHTTGHAGTEARRGPCPEWRGWALTPSASRTMSSRAAASGRAATSSIEVGLAGSVATVIDPLARKPTAGARTAASSHNSRARKAGPTPDPRPARSPRPTRSSAPRPGGGRRRPRAGPPPCRAGPARGRALGPDDRHR